MRKLVVISVDSLFTSDLEKVKDLPGFKEILQDSVVVKNVECIYPTLTYPCHATIMTGHYPEAHGIHHNECLDPAIGNVNWYWYYKDLKVKTIFDYAKENGLTTAAVLWPVTADAPIDYLIPEIWATTYDRENKMIKETASQNMESVYYRHKHLLNWKINPSLDLFGEGALIDLVDQHTPDVLFLHQASLDHARHASGLQHELVDQALMSHGHWIQNIIELYKRKGIFEETTFVILGDHGQLEVRHLVSINEMLRRVGLIETDGKGNVLSYKAYMQSAGISGHLYIKEESARAKALEVLEVAKAMGYIEAIFDKEAAQGLNLAGDFDYVVEGQAGIAISNAVDVEIIESVDTSDYKYAKATHGHLPHKGDKPPFIIYNAQLPSQVITSARLVDEFPTMLSLLGLEIPGGLPGRSLVAHMMV